MNCNGSKLGLASISSALLFCLSTHAISADRGNLPKPGKTKNPAAVVIPLIPERPVSKEEESYWNAIVNLNSRQRFESYLERYPNGFYTEIARIRIAQITGNRVARTKAVRKRDRKIIRRPVGAVRYDAIDPDLYKSLFPVK